MLKANEAMDHKKKGLNFIIYLFLVISLVEDYHLECIGDDLLNIPEHCFPKIPVTVSRTPFLCSFFNTLFTYFQLNLRLSNHF